MIETKIRKFNLLILVFLFGIYSCIPAIADVGIGFLKVGSEEAPILSLRTNFDYDNFNLAVDFNALLHNENLEGIESIVLRNAEYDTVNLGLRCGVLNDITFGGGLLVKNYSTSKKGPVLLNNEQTGLKSYYLGDIFGYEAFGTWSHLYGIRLTQDFGLVSFGESFVADADGVLISTEGKSEIFPPASGWSFDLRAPLGFDTDLYAEAAHLAKHGNGYTVGLLWGYNLIFVGASVRVERRFIESDFIPGYFDSLYEINPIDMTSVESTTSRKDGYLIEGRATLLGLGNLNLIYEYYERSNPALSGDGSINLFDAIFLSMFFKQPSFKDFRKLSLEDGTIIGGAVGFKISPSFSILGHYKKCFNPEAGEVDESTLGELVLAF